MLKYRITEKGIKKAKSIVPLGKPFSVAKEILKYLKGFQTTGKTREKIQKHFVETGIEKKGISDIIRALMQRGYVQSVVVADKDTPAISRRSPKLTRGTPRITPRAGRLK